MIIVKFDDSIDDETDEIPYVSKDLIWTSIDADKKTTPPNTLEISPIKSTTPTASTTSSSSKKKPILLKWDDKGSKVSSSSLSLSSSALPSLS